MIFKVKGIMKSFWHLIIKVELLSLKFSFFTFSMYSSSSSFRNHDFSSSSNGDEEIFNDMERGTNDFSIHISYRQLSRVIQCKIYSLQAMMVACGTINLSYEVFGVIQCKINNPQMVMVGCGTFYFWLRLWSWIRESYNTCSNCWYWIGSVIL